MQEHRAAAEQRTVREYVRDWISVAGPVVEAAGIVGRDGRPVLLQHTVLVGQAFTPREIFALGILDSEPICVRDTVLSFCEHLLISFTAFPTTNTRRCFAVAGDSPLTSFMCKMLQS